MLPIQTGLESLIETPPRWLSGCRLGLLCNPASIDRKFRHSRHLIFDRFPGQLKALYSPQHGFFAEKQDNMIESGNMTDPALHLPVFSLYGQTRKPTQEMFDLIDILIIDLQDAGTRVYTFAQTLSYCLEAAKSLGKKILVLDRPNPITGVMVEGNCLTYEQASFVGRYPIPMRHGLTFAELALMFNDRFAIQCDLEVIPMKGWQRNMYFSDTGLAWVPPSPNLPTPLAAMVYPGQVIWEGTNISEGRGTSQPFEIFGAPFIDTEKIFAALAENCLEGVTLRPIQFEPTSNKWSGTVCSGFQIHITDPCRYQPYRTTLGLLQAVISVHKEHFSWKQPPYEYEYKRLPIDLIIGDSIIRQRIENLDPLEEIEKSWKAGLGEYTAMSRCYHLYLASG
ncbi:MAG: DUF1343 domain-containing protein [Desulfobacterales bacterium]|nr:DUF1343 domain-containing protein [Desulfobacterales bacterium]